MRSIVLLCCLFVVGCVGIADAQNFWERVNPRQQFQKFRHGTHGELFAVNDRSFESLDGGKSWIVFNDLAAETCIAVDSNEVFYCGTSTTLLTSLDSGTTWKDLHFRTTRAVEVINGILYAGGDSGLYRSSDKGLNWTRVYDGGAVDAIAISPSKHFYLQTRGYLFRSDDGIDWTKQVYSTSYTIEQFAFSSTHDVYVALLKDQGGNVDHSSNDGDTWGDAATIGFSSYVLTGVVVTTQNVVYALGSVQSDSDPLIFTGGVGLHSVDALGHVDIVSSGLPHCACRVLTLTPQGKLLASTDSGIYRSVAAVSAVAHSAPLADLGIQNYPNPFSKSTVVRYLLPEAAHVSVAVYNSIGARVASISDCFESSGQHSYTIEATNLPAGVYACEVIAGGLRQVKFVTLQK